MPNYVSKRTKRSLDRSRGLSACAASRGGYAEAQASAAVLKTCRERLNTLFHGENPNHFIFTLNCTDALNLAIKGIARHRKSAALRSR